MAKYRIAYTARFQAEYEDALRYIRYTLSNPIAAENLTPAFENAIKTLYTFPCATKPALIGTPPLAYYSVPVKNYLAFYLVYEDEVVFRRFLYARSDIRKQLESDS